MTKEALLKLITRAKKRDKRALARLISMSENEISKQNSIIKELYKYSGKAHVIGVTGAPGSGKSTLVDCLAMSLSKSKKRVAILAVDPSSPFSGGAILGDRIRMANILHRPDIFLRSMSSRGALGGLSHAALSTIYILDAAGFDYILVETVGVGQGEVDIARCADTCLVVMVPGMGDEVQSIKAGILEIADIFVINKADREGLNVLEKDLLGLINLISYKDNEWKIKISKTIATENSGLEDLAEKILEHKKWYQTSENAGAKKSLIMQKNIIELAATRVKLSIEIGMKEKLEILSRRCLDKKTDPYSAALSLIKLSRL